jgi:hypothetical protein
MFSNMYSLISKENDENCVVDNMLTVFWFNKQNEFENQNNKITASFVEGKLEHGTPNANGLKLLQLLENNYAFLPNKDRLCKHWPTAHWSNRIFLQITQPGRSTVTPLYQLRRLSTVYVILKNV